MRIVWTRPASRDLDEIGDYVARNNVKAATRMKMLISFQVSILTQQPYIGRVGRRVNTRELHITGTSYIAAYRIGKKQIEILRVIHAARDWHKAFDR